jgi:hypothetical protein
MFVAGGLVWTNCCPMSHFLYHYPWSTGLGVPHDQFYPGYLTHFPTPVLQIKIVQVTTIRYGSPFKFYRYRFSRLGTFDKPLSFKASDSMDFGEHDAEFNSFLAALDAVIDFAVVIAAGCACEWWIRKRKADRL